MSEQRGSKKSIARNTWWDMCYTHKWTYDDQTDLRAEYFWMTMEKDCIDYVKKYLKCQVHGDKINTPLVSLFNMMSPWTFTIWGLDVIKPINLKARNQHKFILIAIDYFIKWIEPCSYMHVTYKVIKRFIKRELIYRYGLPKRIVIENAQNFNSKTIIELCAKLKIKHSNSSSYRPKINGVVEAANKNLKKII
jgi:hypothetical protein